MIGKAKWDAWSSLGDMPSAEASRRYIEEADRLVPASARGLKPKGAGAEDRSGFVVVSQPARLDDDDIGDDAKRLVDWCKEGDCERVAAAIHSNEDVNALDDTVCCTAGLTPNSHPYKFFVNLITLIRKPTP
eukprot:Opistho-2@77849